MEGDQSTDWLMTVGRPALRPVMGVLVGALLALAATLATGSPNVGVGGGTPSKLVCYVVSESQVYFDGQFDTQQIGKPEDGEKGAFVHFDFGAMTTSFSWPQDDGGWGTSTEPLQDLGGHIYLSNANETEGRPGYSLYRFVNRMRAGFLFDSAGYVAVLACPGET